MLSDDDQQALDQVRRGLVRDSRSSRRRPAKQGKNQVLFAKAMWVVLGLLTLTLGVFIGVAVMKTDAENRPEISADVSGGEEEKPKPEEEPEPVAPDPKPVVPEPVALDPKPVVPEPKPVVPDPKPVVPNPIPNPVPVPIPEREPPPEILTPLPDETSPPKDPPPDPEKKAPPEVDRIRDLVKNAVDAQVMSRATGTKSPVSAALSKTLQKAWSLATRLKGRARAFQSELRTSIYNARGGCYETLADLATHRVKQQISQIRDRNYIVAVKNYEKAATIKGDPKYGKGIPMKAWSLHRTVVLSLKIAQHHQEMRDSYRGFGRTYPQAYFISRYRLKSHAAMVRIKAEYPKAKNAAGVLLSTITED